VLVDAKQQPAFGGSEVNPGSFLQPLVDAEVALAAHEGRYSAKNES
jgi:hypothetical protein